MPHFSPIMWLMTGIVFYIVLFLFMSLFWWLQNYKFPYIGISENKSYCVKWFWN